MYTIEILKDDFVKEDNIFICTDSKSAIKVLANEGSTSKLSQECKENLKNSIYIPDSWFELMKFTVLSAFYVKCPYNCFDAYYLYIALKKSFRKFKRVRVTQKCLKWLKKINKRFYFYLFNIYYLVF